jgi:predicted RNase H-like nuclease (RuvC/YqgF family)
MFKWQNEKLLVRWKCMGWGSSGTPPWVDEKGIDAEKRKQRAVQVAAKIKALEEENETLKKRIKQLEDELKKLKK